LDTPRYGILRIRDYDGRGLGHCFIEFAGHQECRSEIHLGCGHFFKT